MSVLASIRKRGVLIASIIGIALMIFVLESLFESGNTFFFSSSRDMAEIAGHGIDISEFDTRVKEIEFTAMQRTQQTSLGEEQMESIRNMVWNQYLNEYIMQTEFSKIGLAVPDDELVDLMYGKEPSQALVRNFTDPKTNRVYPQFANPQTGMLDPALLKKHLDKIADEQKDVLVDLESEVRDQQVSEKYFTLIKAGLSASSLDGKLESTSATRKVNFRYVGRKFSEIQDSTITVSDADVKKYYNEHLNNYKQEAGRKVEYVIYDVIPSKEDYKDADDNMKKIAEEMKTSKSDSALLARESDNKSFDQAFYKKGQLMPSMPDIDSLLFAGDSGTVIGPYVDKSYTEKMILKISKVKAVKYESDSVKARHILVRITGDTARAKSKADSLKKIVSNKSRFTDLAKKFSADSGSGKKGGDLGWFKRGEMVGEFEKAAFDAKKGDVVVVQTVYGFHIIDILEKGVETRRVQVLTLDKAVEPGNKTRQEAYLKASDFAGQYNTTALFEKGCEKEGLNKRVVESLKETDKTITGLDSPRDLMRWAFSDDTKPGTVRTEPFQFGNKYVVATLADIREKGNAPLEAVRQEVEVAAKQLKKAGKFKEEFAKYISSASSNIDMLGQKMNQKVNRVEGTSFSQFNITDMGHEPNVLGILFAMKEGQMSRPIAGEQGVYVVFVEKFTQEENKDKGFTEIRNNLATQMGYRAESEVYNALKENANVKDNRIKFF